MAQNETNKQEMKQEKITPESFFRDKAFPNGIEDAAWEAWKRAHSGIAWSGFAIKLMEDYHLQSLQQLLDEASEELPDKEKINKYHTESGIKAKGAMSFFWNEGAQWMRSEAAKTVVKLKEDNDRSIKALGNSYDKARAEIQQLKEELARREGLDGFRKYLTKNKFYSTLTHLDQYQASKTDKP